MLFRLPGVPVRPLESVSNATAVVFSFSKARELLRPTTLPLDSLLGQLLDTSQFQTNLALLRQTLHQQIADHTPLLVSLQNPGSGKLALLAAADIRRQTFDIQIFINKLPSRQVQRFYYKGSPIYRVILSSRQEVTVAQFRNVLLVAPYPLLVEEAINRLKKPASVLTKRAHFKPLLRPYFSNTAFSVFVNVENLPLLLADWLQTKDELLHWQTVLRWLRIEFQPDQETVRLNGAFSFPNSQNMWRAAHAQQPRPIGAMMRVIPDNVALVQWWSLSNPGRFFRRASDLSSKPLEKYVSPWAGTELGLVRTQEDRYVVIKVKKNAKPETQLNELAKQAGELKPYSYGIFTIRQLLEETLLEPLYGKGNFANPYFTIIEDFVVFASSRSGLEVWIDQYMANKTMGHSTNFLRLYQKWKNKPINGFLFLNLVNFAPRLRTALRTQGLLQKDLEKLGHVGLMVQAKTGRWQLEGDWRTAAGAVVNQTNIAWKRRLDHEALVPPALIGNGTAEEPYAIAIQDTAFQLYLLDVNGNVWWKKKLENRILSPVQAVPYFKNGRAQLVFNTPHNLYLLDRNGTPQGTFPLRLQTPATNGVTVVDFDGNGEYSFFVACANGSVYGFDRLGRPLQGWNPLRGVGEVRHPLVHFQQDGKDYLLVLNEAGRLFAFQRNGSRRFNTINLGKSCPEPPQVQSSGNSSRIVVTDKNGTAHIIGLNGSTFRLQLQPNARNLRFAFADFAGDERKDYVAVSDTLLTAHYYEGTAFKRLYQHDFSVPQREVLAVPIPNQTKALVGTVSAQKQQISVLLADGQLHPDFPLAGTTRFFVTDLFQNGQQILIVANGDSVYAYRVKLGN